MTMTLEQQAPRAGSNHPQDKAPERNVGFNDRLWSAAAGGVLTALALRRGGWTGLAMITAGAGLMRRAYTAHCPMYQAFGFDSLGRAANPSEYSTRSVHVDQSLTIEKTASELFQYWRDFRNLPHLMRHLKDVEVLDDRRSRWTAKAPAGVTVQWDAEIINEEPNRLIAWRSLGGASVHNAGSVRFIETGDRGTEVHVIVDYIPPAGRLGKWIAWLFGEDPNTQIRDDLRRFKQVMEAGEVPTTEGQPTGSCATKHDDHRHARNGAHHARSGNTR